MIYVLIAVILYFCVAVILQNNEHRKRENSLVDLVREAQEMTKQCIDRATTERQQLLDRIQAPSFDHLKHHEVKVIKAKNGEKEPVPLEPL